MVIWKDIRVKIRHKCQHVKKIGGRLYNAFVLDHGDIPCVRFNEDTKQFEEVVNNRGRAYAARKRQMYRENKKREAV